MGTQIPRRDLNGDSRERKYKSNKPTEEELCGRPSWEKEYYRRMESKPIR